MQWSADGTERAHIEVIKNPSDFSNNQNYESQICRHLDRTEKCRKFNLSTALRDDAVPLDERAASTTATARNNLDDYASDDDGAAHNDHENQASPRPTGSSATRFADYFARASILSTSNASGGDVPGKHLCPLRTFCPSQSTVAFHLNRDPPFKQMTIDETAVLFGIPDLHQALADYLQRLSRVNDGHIRVFGGRRSCTSKDTHLPFTHLQVWKKFRLQNKAYHSPHQPLPSCTVNACPPSGEWSLGHYDPVVVNLDPANKWPHSGLKGVHICLILVDSLF